MTILLFLHRLQWDFLGGFRSGKPTHDFIEEQGNAAITAFTLKMVVIRHLYKHRTSKHTLICIGAHTQEHFLSKHSHCSNDSLLNGIFAFHSVLCEGNMKSNTHTHASEHIHQTHAHSRFIIMVIETCPNARIHTHTHKRAAKSVHNTSYTNTHAKNMGHISYA